MTQDLYIKMCRLWLRGYTITCTDVLLLKNNYMSGLWYQWRYQMGDCKTVIGCLCFPQHVCSLLRMKTTLKKLFKLFKFCYRYIVNVNINS